MFKRSLPEAYLVRLIKRVIAKEEKTRFFRATCVGAGDEDGEVQVQRPGEPVADGGSHKVLVPYASGIYGNTGGPQHGDDMLIEETSPGNTVVMGRLSPVS